MFRLLLKEPDSGRWSRPPLATTPQVLKMADKGRRPGPSLQAEVQVGDAREEHESSSEKMVGADQALPTRHEDLWR